MELLFQGLVLQSGNDAANALARTAGGIEETVEAMNETAAELGAFDTVAGSPSGLDVAGQSSSPYDLALVFRALIDEPDAVEILQTPTAQMPPVPGRSPGYQIQNQDPLLGTYPGTIGGKTGLHRRRPAHVRERGRARTAGCSSSASWTPRTRRCGRPTRRSSLLDWGFALPDDVDGVGELVGSGRGAGHGADGDERAAVDRPADRATRSVGRRPGRRRRLGAAAARPGRHRGAHRGGDADRSSSRPASRPAACSAVGSQGGSTGAGFHGTGVAASTDRRVAVHPAVKNAKRATMLIHTSSPTAPPKADAVTLVEMRVR